MAGRCHHYTEELEKLPASQIFSGTDGSNGLERIQGQEALLSNVREREAAAGNGQGIPGSPQVSRGARIVWQIPKMLELSAVDSMGCFSIFHLFTFLIKFSNKQFSLKSK